MVDFVHATAGLVGWDIDLEREHVQERMVDRHFNETDLRTMYADALGVELSHTPGRFLVRAVWLNRPATIIVEPDPVRGVVVVITLFFP